MPSPDRPNIIFIVVDDCGYADLGCTGQTGYRTPALDRLAVEGVRFTQSYANAPLCTNTRVAMITGRYQYRLKHRPGRTAAPASTATNPIWAFRRTSRPCRSCCVTPIIKHRADSASGISAFCRDYSPLSSGYDEFFGIMGGFTGYYTHKGEGGEA